MDAAALQQFPNPPVELRSRTEILFCHPGYPEPNYLLSLPRTDPTQTGTFGVHHRTALLACQIIANNAFDTGYLTLDQAGQQRVDTPLDGVLTEATYYLFIRSGPGKYYIIPSSSCLP